MLAHGTSYDAAAKSRWLRSIEGLVWSRITHVVVRSSARRVARDEQRVQHIS
jgi:hypothetical protein